VRTAARLLGRPYWISGKIVPGDGRGRTIGIPTANLDTQPERAMPRVGVYACRAVFDGVHYPAVTNIGVRPTFVKQQVAPRAETHLLAYSGDLYGKQARLEFVARLRDEQRFLNADALVAQIQADIRQAKKVLGVK
jgi:riboflavin kinase/FMN adenylyltransferase